MKKQEIVEKLKLYPDCLFTLSHVKELVDSIEDNVNITKLENTSVINDLLNHIEKTLVSLSVKSLVDQESITYKTIQNKLYIDNMELNTEGIRFQIRSAVIEFFDNLQITFISQVNSEKENDEHEEEFHVGEAQP